MDWAGKELKIKEMNDWYNVKTIDLYPLGGAGLLRAKYQSSLSLLLTNVYPENKWLPWQFNVTSSKFWADNKNKKMFLDWVSEQLNVKEPSDWANVSKKVEKGYKREIFNWQRI